MSHNQFKWDDRLQIALPALTREWDAFSRQEQEQMVAVWEEIRGQIPDRIKRLEQHIRIKQDKLYEEDNFEQSCRLNTQIAELASRINDLQIWYRMNQEVEPRRHSG